MPDILAGAIIREDDRPAAAFASDETGISNISNTTYAAGTPVVELTFTAPTSGRVWVFIGGGMRDGGTATNIGVWMAPEIRLGSVSGAVVLAADAEDRGVGSLRNKNQYHYYSRMTRVTGLTAGATYYARVMHRVTTGSSADISAREIGVFPA